MGVQSAKLPQDKSILGDKRDSSCFIAVVSETLAARKYVLKFPVLRIFSGRETPLRFDVWFARLIWQSPQLFALRICLAALSLQHRA
jgi:hypothetical protein